MCYSGLGHTLVSRILIPNKILTIFLQSYIGIKSTEFTLHPPPTQHHQQSTFCVIIMFNQLYECFEENDILTHCQYGFRKTYVTQFAANELIDRLTNCSLLRKTLFNLYIDLSKAFGALNHDGILYKLEF